LFALAAMVSAARSTTPLASRTWVPSLWMTAQASEVAPAPETSVAAEKTDTSASDTAKNDAAKTDAAKTAAGKTEAVPEGKNDVGPGTMVLFRQYALAILTYPLTIALVIVIVSYAFARLLSERLRMPDFSWKIGLVAFTVIAAAYTSWVGISN